MNNKNTATFNTANSMTERCYLISVKQYILRPKHPELLWYHVIVHGVCSVEPHSRKQEIRKFSKPMPYFATISDVCQSNLIEN